MNEYSDCPVGGVAPLLERPLATMEVEGVAFIAILKKMKENNK